MTITGDDFDAEQGLKIILNHLEKLGDYKFGPFPASPGKVGIRGPGGEAILSWKSYTHFSPNTLDTIRELIPVLKPWFKFKREHFKGYKGRQYHYLVFETGYDFREIAKVEGQKIAEAIHKHFKSKGR